jgi:hypothetical protein
MWTAITIIVIVSVAGSAWFRHLESKKAVTDDETLKALNEKMDKLDADLRQRVETLERIVTDSKEDLKRQFDRLDKTG